MRWVADNTKVLWFMMGGWWHELLAPIVLCTKNDRKQRWVMSHPPPSHHLISP